MQRSQVELVLATLLVLLASSRGVVAQHAIVSGVVRDGSGVAQLGVLVQVSAPDSSIAGRAFTDLRGRYLVAGLMPGLYQVQATGALFAPALKPHLELRAGARTIVNLTLNTIFDTTSWLPAERRKADEPTDDWAWTLRAAANRPILRVLEDGKLVMVSSSATESKAPSVRGRAAMTSGDGGFGGGGIHNIITVDKVQEDGSGIVIRTDAGAGRTQYGVGPSTELSAGFERKTGFDSTTRAVVSFQSHPEFVSAGNVNGLQNMQLATAQRTKLGNLVNLEAGGTVYAVRTGAYAFVAQPFLKVMVEPAAGWTVGYRMATSRDVQEFSGLNAVQPEVPVAVMFRGKAQTERGRHQEIAVGRRVGRGQVQMALYTDNLDRVTLAGDGLLTQTDLASVGTMPIPTGGIADAMTDNFRLLSGGYKARGVNLMMTQPLGQNMWVAAEYSSGSGLGSDATLTDKLPVLLGGLRLKAGQSAAVALKGTLPASGTKIRTVYRWQPHGLVTAIDPYREFSDQAFLSFHVRQPMHWEGLLPPGLEASVDVSNLLAQGYQPFLSADGRTLFLAQTPRTLQAGLAFTF